MVLYTFFCKWITIKLWTEITNPESEFWVGDSESLTNSSTETTDKPQIY